MEIEYTDQALEDLDYWRKSGYTPVQAKIQALLLPIVQDSKKGLGKPEHLKHNYTGYWSRRINKEHRLVYEILEDKIRVHKLRFHY